MLYRLVLQQAASFLLQAEATANAGLLQLCDDGFNAFLERGAQAHGFSIFGPLASVRLRSRRAASAISGQLARLKLGGASPEAHERCRDTQRMAFRSTFEGFETDRVERSLRGKAEMLRRLNNIDFYASLFLQAEGSIGDLHPDFNNEKFGQLLARLKAEAAVIQREWFYAHTIGAAHHVRLERAEADAAADALLKLLAASGAIAQTEAIRLAIDDAFSWKRAAAGETQW